ncbi:hypothetical protein AB0300_18770 [Microbacterium sp. NPDC078814]|uniref:hypothetical protein n=1 Tax=Microbacterium sp. NPDC078814 TaxID=3154767 RepID=UPI00344B3881
MTEIEYEITEECTYSHLLASHKWVVRYGFCECGYECDAHEWVRHVAVLTATLASRTEAAF